MEEEGAHVQKVIFLTAFELFGNFYEYRHLDIMIMRSKHFLRSSKHHTLSMWSSFVL